MWRSFLVFGACAAECNLTRFHEWYESDYIELAEITNERTSVTRGAGFWGITESLVYTDYQPSYGIVMDKAAKVCRQSLEQLRGDLAGRHGDVHAYDVHNGMCSDACVDSDVLRIEAMRQSGCDCLELSPDETDVNYSVRGEFCRQNSGRILCDELEICGVWDCRLGDFMCPRHEYNKGHTRFQGLGDCSAAISTSPTIAIFFLAVVVPIFVWR